MRTHWRWMKRWLTLGAGWGFVVLGVIGLFLPILQGFLFLAIGFYILSTVSPWAQRQLDRMRARHPELAATFDAAKDRAADWLRRHNGTDGNDKNGGAR
ncbi:MAG: PGPGW domain-containing protein [Rhodospirillales bacterium]|nr:PGPGW domain-containing protein [Rhodospirillales bacterium]